MASSPLLWPPTELHYKILDLLEIQDKARLSCTNVYFSLLIKPPTLQEFLVAETTQWAIDRCLFSCRGCVRLRPLRKFTDDMRKGKRGRNGVDAGARFCIDCGVDRDWFPLGAEYTIMGKRWVKCKAQRCGRFTDQAGSKGLCNIHSPATKSLQKTRTQPQNSNTQYESEDEWAIATRFCAGGKHSEEMYGMWPDA